MTATHLRSSEFTRGSKLFAVSAKGEMTNEPNPSHDKTAFPSRGQGFWVPMQKKN
jgi:hypothetical protein